VDAEYKETLTRRVIYYLKSPAPYEEVMKAVTVARHRYKALTGKEATSGDIPMIASYDDEVHIWFEVQEKP
jgi:hypothetical protein